MFRVEILKRKASNYFGVFKLLNSEGVFFGCMILSVFLIQILYFMGYLHIDAEILICNLSILILLSFLKLLYNYTVVLFVNKEHY